MKKRLLSLALALLLALTAAAPAAAANVVLSPQKLTVDGRSVQCEKYNIDGSNYFKLRDLAMLLRGTDCRFGVSWDAAANAVIIAPGLPYEPVGGELRVGEDKSATAVPSSQTLWFLDAPVSDLSVYNIGGNNFFKLRDLGALLGFIVDYDPATDTAIVVSGSEDAAAQVQAASYFGLIDWTMEHANDDALGIPAFTRQELVFSTGDWANISVVAAADGPVSLLSIYYTYDYADGGQDAAWIFFEPDSRDYDAGYDHFPAGAEEPDYSLEFTLNPAAFSGSVPIAGGTETGPLAGTDRAGEMRAAATIGICNALMQLWDLCQYVITPAGAYDISDFGFATAQLSTAGLTKN